MTGGCARFYLHGIDNCVLPKLQNSKIIRRHNTADKYRYKDIHPKGSLRKLNIQVPYISCSRDFKSSACDAKAIFKYWHT